QCSLRCLVSYQRIGADSSDAANVGNAAGLLGSHDWKHVLADQHGSIEIDIEDVVPSAPLDFDRITLRTPVTDIIVKDIDPTELGNSGADESCAIALLTDIGSYAFGIEPFLT